MSKPKLVFFVITTALFSIALAQAQMPAAGARGAAATPSSTLVQPRASPHDTINMRLSGNLITIIYGRPYAKGRKIFGDASDKALVPFGQVWRTGADEATTLITPVPLTFGSVTIPAGAYTLDTVPMKDGPWKFIINKSIGRWGIPYDEKAQAANEFPRIDMKTEPLDKPVEQFTMALESNPAGGGLIKMMWENTQASIPFALAK